MYALVLAGRRRLWCWGSSLVLEESNARGDGSLGKQGEGGGEEGAVIDEGDYGSAPSADGSYTLAGGDWGMSTALVLAGWGKWGRAGEKSGGERGPQGCVHSRRSERSN